MSNTGKLKIQSTASTSVIVRYAIMTFLEVFLLIGLISTISDYKDNNYWGNYDDEITQTTVLAIVLGIGIFYDFALIGGVVGQHIEIYEHVISGCAKKGFASNRVVDIRYNDIRNVTYNSCYVRITTKNDEIVFQVNDTENVAKAIEHQLKKSDGHKITEQEPEYDSEPDDCAELRDSTSYIDSFIDDNEPREAHFLNLDAEHIICPFCNTKQKSSRTSCFKCNAEFIFEYDDV